MTFSISMLGDRIEQLLNLQAKEVLAADLVLESTSPLTGQQYATISSSPLAVANTVTFRSMANADSSGNFLLSSVKAVSNAYPLRGELQITDRLYTDAYAVDGIPDKGEAWVEDRVLHELNTQIDGFINVGEQSFKVTRVLVFEPDRGNSFYSFTPRILINLEDLEATQVVKPGSRVKYRYLFSGNDDQLNSLVEEMVDTLSLNQQFISLESSSQTLSDTFDRAYRFLNITALIAVLLGAVAAALVSFHYANEMTFQYALLRCIGMRSKQMMATIIIPLIIYALAAILAGFLVGLIAQAMIVESLGELIPEDLPEATIKPYIVSAMTALIIIVSFVWPFVKTLLNTPPKLLLNEKSSQQRSLYFTSLFILIGISTLIYIATNDVLTSVYIIGVLFVFIIISLLATRYSISLLLKSAAKKSTSTMLAARSLNANRLMVSVQIVAVALTFFSLALIGTIRDDLVTSWQSKVPDDAPNVFAINLSSRDADGFLEYLKQNNITHSPLYPISRGRLSAVNDIAISDYANKDTGRYDDSLERDLALTWSNEIPADNKIIEGKWHQTGNEEVTVSIEEELANDLDISVGDMLTFTIETHQLSARVASIRSVVWESFSPNFYMMFSPNALDGLPTTYIASLYLEQNQRNIIGEFVKKFPSASFFDVEFLLNRIRQIIEKVGYAVEAILYFALLSSILVFISIEMILRNYRAYSARRHCPASDCRGSRSARGRLRCRRSAVHCCWRARCDSAGVWTAHLRG
ncbi:MAG: FtsX-like permease family protein, partial [Pseudomonadota bacterium]